MPGSPAHTAPTLALGLALTTAGMAALWGACEPRASRYEVVQVFAASSLTEAFGALEAAYEAAHPEVEIEISFAGSQVLRLQIEQGAAAHLFASANHGHLEALAETGHALDTRVFAETELALIVPARNPAGIHRFSDLTRARHIVVGAPNVPIGIYTRYLFAHAEAELGARFASHVESRIVSREPSVRLVRAKVELGEADAAIVYRTDALGSQRVKALAIPEHINVQARYSLGVLSPQAEASAFAEFVLSKAGQDILGRFGFRPGGE